jgi:hypothetical protein
MTAARTELLLALTVAAFTATVASAGETTAVLARPTRTMRHCIATDPGKRLTIQRIRLGEAWGERARRLEFQHRNGAGCKTPLTGDRTAPWYQETLD